MKRLATVVGAGALMMVLGACGQAQQSSSTPAQVEPANGIAPAPQGSERAVSEDKVDGTRLPADYPKQAWTDDNGAVLTVQGQEGGCEHVSAQLAEQTSTAVRITLVRDLTGTNRPCTKDLRIKKLTVRLDKPLSDRSVVLDEKTVRS